MKKSFVFLLLIAGLAAWMAGCSSTSTTNPTATDSSVSDQFGGYTATSEQPGFGDADLLAGAQGEEAVDDPILASPPVQAIVSDINYGLFQFRAVWGQLEYDSTVTDVSDWSGSLTVTAGALVIRRVIRFERPTDYIMPRTDRKKIEWVSFTTVHNDGIAVDVYVPPQRPTLDSSYVPDGEGDSTLVVDTIPAAPVTLTFQAGTYSRTFSLDELAALDDVVNFDNGTSIAFHGVQYMRQACPRGILAGFWGYDSDGNGVFKGIWFSKHGFVDGYLEGNFGTDDTGANVYYGKWIDQTGQFQGLLRGTYGFYAAQAANAVRRRGAGWFKGNIFDGSGSQIGDMAGLYKAARFVMGGWFQGRWKLDCPIDNGSDSTTVAVYNDGF